MDTRTILVVEDDENLRIALTDNLQDEGYSVSAVGNLSDAWARFVEEEFKLVILDLMLPDGDGYTLCGRIRGKNAQVGILMLTARSLEEDLLKGFEVGADDYLTKPFRLKELLARVRALLRRRTEIQGGRLIFGGYTVDTGARAIVDADGNEVEMTPKEYDLLVCLLTNKDRVLSRDALLDKVWGVGVVVDYRTVDNFVSNLRRKFDCTESSGFRIKTVRGVGYRLEVD